jgi:hypothetical protein
MNIDRFRLRHFARTALGLPLTLAFVLSGAGLAVAQAPSVPIAAETETTPETSARPLGKADLDRFIAWYQGRWDNEAQVAAQEAENVPPEGRIERVTHFVAAFQHEGFGRVAQAANPRDVRFLYIESRRNEGGAQDAPFRQRLYRVYIDPQRQHIRLENHALPQPELFAGAYQQPARLQAVKAGQTTHRPGCDVFFRWDGARFIGHPDRGACRFTSAVYGNVPVVIDDDFVATGEDLWSRDRGTTPEGAYVYGNRLGLSAKHRRARPFQCTVAVSDAKGRREETVRLHDQGARYDLRVTLAGLIADSGRRSRAAGAAESAPLDLRLRRIRWEADRRPDSLSLSLVERGREEAVLSASAPARDRAVTLEVPGLTAACTEQESLF